MISRFFNKEALGLLIFGISFFSSSYNVCAADDALVAKGKSIYMANCIACHNKDPNKNGSLGPILVGTPLEVFLVKVPEGQAYPAGYTPKRKTKIMKKFPQLKKDVPAIYAWIQSQALVKK